MTNATSSTTQQSPKNLVLVKDANEWGQITDLEKNATYYVIRKPTKELTREMRTQFVTDVRSFLHEHRVLTEKQFEEINTRYGEPAKVKAKELRETMEKKFDEIAKEFETRVEQLETEFQTRFAGKNKESKDAKTETATASETTTTSAVGETPGEMPHGESHHESSSATASKTPAKKAAKKTE